MKIVLASNNAHKIQELQALLGTTYEVVSMHDIGCEHDIEETGSNMEENALIKAKYLADNYGVITVSDDSGLEVNALNNRPGVYSARYAGIHGDHTANIDKVLSEMTGISNRAARFRTVICYINGEEILQFEGIINGKLLHHCEGEGGFGYDPIFVPSGYTKTFAQMSNSEKNKISHRAMATKKLIQHLQKK